MSSQLAPVTLGDLQRPVRARLERVPHELRRIVEADFGLIAKVNSHLFQMQGKMFRPTLLLLADEATGGRDPRTITLAATVELIHLATLVHDDSVDHSVLRRGMPTINSLFSHQVSVIMGDYLYSRAVIELVRLDDMEPLRVLSRVTNEMTVGEMRQLLAHEPLEFSEEAYDLLIQAKTASLLSGACEVGALRAPAENATALRRYGEALGMAFQIVDDLLDYVGDPSVTGKPTGSDLREHKVTLAADRRPHPDGRGRPAAGGSADGSGRAGRRADRRGDRGRGGGRRARLRPGAGPPAGAAGRRGARQPAGLPGAGRAPGQHHLRRGSQALMASPHRPGFYLGILVAGFIAGGALTSLLRQTLPDSAARTFFTSTWTANFGPVSADLLVLNFTLGPIGLHVSLLALIGVVVAYLIARSIF